MGLYQIFFKFCKFFPQNVSIPVHTARWCIWPSPIDWENLDTNAYDLYDYIIFIFIVIFILHFSNTCTCNKMLKSHVISQQLNVIL